VDTPVRTTELSLDERRRTSLARVGRKADTKYLAEEYDDGTIVLVPAATVSTIERAVLSDPELRARLAAAASPDPSQLRRRGSFARFA
jgi:hypothetical protein